MITNGILFLLFISPFLVNSDHLHAKSNPSHINLIELLEDVSVHPLLVKKQWEQNEKKQNQEALQGLFDWQLKTSPAYILKKNKADGLKGFSGTAEVKKWSLESEASKFLPIGMAVGGKLKLSGSDIENGEFAGNPMQPKLPESMELNDLGAELFAKIPLYHNYANEQFTLQKKILGKQVEVSLLQATMVTSQIKLSLISIYWDIYLHQVILKNLQHSLTRKKLLHKSNRRKAELGLAEKSELILSELNILSTEDEIEQKQKLLEQKYIKLSSLISLISKDKKRAPYVKWAKINSPKGELQPLTLLNKAKGSMLTLHPVLKQLQSTSETLDKSLALNRMQQKSKWDLITSVASNASEEEWDDTSDKFFSGDYPTFMLKLDVSINPSSNKMNSDFKALKAKKSQIAAERQNIIASVQQLFDESRSKIQMHEEQLKRLKKIHKKRKKLLTIQTKEFNIGKIPTSVFLDTQNLFDATKIVEAQNYISLHLTLASFLSQTGQLELYQKQLKEML